MRSSWSAESVLAVLAAASVEAAGLTLPYLAVNWIAGRHDIHFGIPSFAVAVLIGLFLARRLGHASWTQYLLVVPGAGVLVGATGAWLAEASAGAPADPIALLANAGTWLLGVCVLRGTAHAELADEGYTVERLLRVGVPGIAAFWIVAALSGLTANPAYTADAFGATLAFVSSALLALGLARLVELEVESIDLAARRRWLALLFGVSGLLLLVGVPLAALLDVPLGTAIAGATGPLAPFIVVVFTLLAAPILLIASALADAIGPVDIHLDLPVFRPGGTDGTVAPVDLLTVVVVVVGVLAALDLIAIVIVIAATLRQRRRQRGAPGPEVREAEPVAIGRLLRLPQVRRRRFRGGAPRNAVEAYRLALVALAGRDEGRRAGETPREHATRIRGSAIGPPVGRLAADYQLDALGGRRLSEAEERRATARWLRIRRWAR